jgi:hypothetical protein
MQKEEQTLHFEIGSKEILDDISSVQACRVFDEEVLAFLETLSTLIRRHKATSAYSDLMTFAFWCRRASLKEMKEAHTKQGIRIGRGVAFHITPSNIPMNFAYSLVASLLAGNANIVRLPSKSHPQVEIFLRVMEEALQRHPKQRARLLLVRYPHHLEYNDLFSSLCDVRLIWGGNQTITSLRKSPVGPRVQDLLFANRYSICIIQSDVYCKENRDEEYARAFYLDTYYMDQNACSSPKFVIWLGKEKEQAKARFWRALQEQAEKSYQLEPIQILDKLVSVASMATRVNDFVQPKLQAVDARHLLYRVQVQSLDATLLEGTQHSGLFLEYEAADFTEILPLCASSLQTVVTIGISKEEMEMFCKAYAPRGIDRVVEVGHAMDFSLDWDGYDLIEALSKHISIAIG